MRALVRVAALWIGCAILGCATLGCPERAAAQGAADFYRQKTVKLTITYEPGGSYDLYARLAAAHLGKHVPGNPAIVVQYMPGAGGLIGIQHLYEKAAQDGSEIAILPRNLAVNQRLRPETARYDSRRFGWIGTLSSYANVLYVAQRVGVKSAQDLRTIPVVTGSWGVTSETHVTMSILNALAGTKFKIVSGYRGGPDVDLAVERGEVDGRMGSWTLLKSQRGRWLREGYVVIPFQAGVKPHPELANIPMVDTMASTDESRRVIEFQSSDTGIGWSLVAPPDLPPERVSVLRHAFDKMLGDPDFLADAQQRGLEVTPANGQELEALVSRTVATSADALETLKRILGTH
jgi:tripartite-type tricarboxylate transporter receptor subunit TctC